jgi:cytochrome c oxidase cbb3-type subunit 2
MTSQSETKCSFAGWHGIGLIAITYIYFLIFAQFGFLKRLSGMGIAGDELKAVMGAMAFGGIGASLLAPPLAKFSPVRRMQSAFGGCVAGATLTLLPINLYGALGISLLIGASLGLLTVTLVTHLKWWLGTEQPLLKIGLGVGLAYLICNYPGLFESSPIAMALVSAGLCLCGIVIAGSSDASEPETEHAPAGSASAPAFLMVLACFTALVWLDSAAFFIIQNTPALKSGTWEGSRRLWQNGGVHLIAALVGAGLLKRYGLSVTLGIAFAFLGGACLLLANPSGAALASVAYPIGVSIYSVALVAYPAFLAFSNTPQERTRSAGWLYAVAGWIGSGLGIGMGENLRRIPPAFVLAAALLLLSPFLVDLCRRRHLELLSLIPLFGGAWILVKCEPATRERSNGLDEPSIVEAGHEVYLAEGCIHCHSQFIRPNSPDAVMWGAATDVTSSRTQCPPLIGNRRQGPDLSTIGTRRSVLWLKAHFMDPSSMSFHSIMPSYAYLFNDGRGEALLAYVQSLGATNLAERLVAQSVWQPPDAAPAKNMDSMKLVQEHCLTCHSTTGAVRETWGSGFKRLPPDFVSGPFVYAPLMADEKWRRNRIAEIIKFGLPGTDMPGHEYLPDAEIAAIAAQIATFAEVKRP